MSKAKRTKRTRTADGKPTPALNDYNELARLISGVLNHPLTPDKLHMAVADALSNITRTDAMDAPETIGCILHHHAIRQESEAR